MGFDVGHRLGTDSCFPMSGSDDRGLTFDAWCRITDFRRAVIIGCRAPDNRVDGVPVCLRTREALEYHNSGAAAGNSSFRFDVKRPTVTVGR